MKEIKLKGSYYEMGTQLGKMIQGKLHLPEPDTNKLEWASVCENTMQQYTPELLEELQGIADAANLNKVRLNAIILWDCSYIKSFSTTSKHHCTVFTVPGKHTESGKPVMARNYDWSTEVRDYIAMHYISPLNKIRNVLFTDHFVGGFDGVNEAGLACGCTVAAYYNGDVKPGIMLNMAIRWILDSFTTVQEAVNFLEEVQLCEGNIYLIADKSGACARVEATPNKVFTTYTQDEFLIATNHFQSNEMKRLEDQITDTNAHTTLTRLEGIQNWYSAHKKPIPIDSIKLILRDHKYGVCDHVKGVIYSENGNRKEEDIASTLFSWIATLGINELDVCLGSPCKNDYHTKSVFSS
ncbi:MAG: C45 family autoproteolytic acyltransferase/hydrolase [Candidatus Hodarchaeota archaeon]